MARFFFDILDGDDLLNDDEGLDLDSIEMARREAEQTLSEIAKELFIAGSLQRALSVIVRHNGRQMFVVAMPLGGSRSVH
jgi:hypothetical protein